MSGNAPRILVAEDNPALQTVIRFNLQRGGYDVTVAQNGAEAWEKLEQSGPFDLLITDQQMPQMTGVELVERMRQDDRWQQVPVFLLTAKSLELERGSLKQQLGVAGLFAKPFSPLALLQSVQQLLGATVT